MNNGAPIRKRLVKSNRNCDGEIVWCEAVAVKIERHECDVLWDAASRGENMASVD